MQQLQLCNIDYYDKLKEMFTYHMECIQGLLPVSIFLNRQTVPKVCF